MVEKSDNREELKIDIAGGESEESGSDSDH